MPLLRRNSSKKEGDPAHTTGDKDAKPSFLSHFGRRRSTSQGRKNTQLNEVRIPGDEAVVVEVRPKSNEHDQPSVSQFVPNLTPPETQQNSVSTTQEAAMSATNTIEGQFHGPPLTKEDIKALFFGAPHFMLEKGKHGRVYPQAFFPWNNELEVSDLQDRRYLKHEAFALATQHAHLPIPDEVSWKPGVQGPMKREGLEIGRRPMFDLGVFEIPNMLALEGREAGTVGMRWFLEFPISDHLRGAGKLGKHAKKYANDDLMSTMSANEALKTLGKGEVVTIGKHGPTQDRLKFVREGPHAWRTIGVRDVSYSFIAHRLAQVCEWRDEVVQGGWKVTVLDKQSCTELFHHLFDSILFQPEGIDIKPDDFKVQLEALIKVLTTPGAWLDFSDVQPRFEIGKILWQGPDSQERKWLWIQILLSIELVLREDAALRVGLAQTSDVLRVTSEELHHFNKLRNLKVDWDLLVARRLLDLCRIQPVSRRNLEPVSKQSKSDVRPQHQHLFSELKQKLHLEEDSAPDEWDCVIIPRKPEVMLDGLLRFSTNIGWPKAHKIDEVLRSKLIPNGEVSTAYWAKRCLGTKETSSELSLVRRDDWDVQTLHPANEYSTGGWLSRTWLAGFVLPGFSANTLLMSCLLENDAEAISKLGTTVTLRQGFVLNKQSWWSKGSIVGRVMAPRAGTLECMGWLSLPGFVPVFADGQPRDDGWVEAVVQPVPDMGQDVRIHDVDRLGLDSNPLGTGHGQIYGTEFILVTDAVLDHKSAPRIGSLTLKMVRLEDAGSHSRCAATVTFELTGDRTSPNTLVQLNLHYDSFFVSAYPCRTPRGHLASEPAVHTGHRPLHRPAEALPAHPLHRSYRFIVKSVLELQDAEPPNPTDWTDPIWIIDARGSAEADIYARTWCSHVGRHALVARSGSSCLSCAIRECRALHVGVIIRVASKG